jgi:hypothetical protein
VRRDQTATEWVLAAPLTGKSLQLTGKPLPLFLRLSKLAPGVETEAPGAVHLGKIGISALKAPLQKLAVPG